MFCLGKYGVLRKITEEKKEEKQDSAYLEHARKSLELEMFS